MCISLIYSIVAVCEFALFCLNLHRECVVGACFFVAQAGAGHDVAEVLLKEAREAVLAKLEELKTLFVVSKSPIKHNFPPEVWLSFVMPSPFTVWSALFSLVVALVLSVLFAFFTTVAAV